VKIIVKKWSQSKNKKGMQLTTSVRRLALGLMQNLSLRMMMTHSDLPLLQQHPRKMVKHGVYGMKKKLHTRARTKWFKKNQCSWDGLWKNGEDLKAWNELNKEQQQYAEKKGFDESSWITAGK
jgi:hypothetical protein